MFGLTQLGVVHTLISLLALAAGITALVRNHEISPHNKIGQLYIWATVLTCLTSFGIFQHGGFGKPHVLAILTILVLGFATWVGRSKPFGRFSRPIEVGSYSFSFLLHLVPGTIETLTRLPLGAPKFSGAEDPGLAPVLGTVFLLWAIGVVVQLRGVSKKT
jgi:uncharacterized membrane protein